MPADPARQVILPLRDLCHDALAARRRARPREAPPALVLVAGHPGTGKSALGHLLAAVTGWVLLDLDTVTRFMTQALLLELGADPNDRHGPVYRDTVRPLAYRCLLDTAFENLRLGTTAIVVAPFEREVTDAAWLEHIRGKCARAGVAIAVVWLTCDVASMHDHLEIRDAARDSWMLTHWNEHVDTLDLKARPACAHYLIDLAYHDQATLLDATGHARGALRVREPG
jgi:predicted kinase